MVILILIASALVFSVLISILYPDLSVVKSSFLVSLLITIIFQVANMVYLGFVDPFSLIAAPISFLLTFGTALIGAKMIKKLRSV